MKLYVDVKEKKERKEFLDYLYLKGYSLAEDCKESKLLNSIFPITIIDKKINYVRTTLIASCSIKLHKSIDEVKAIIENNK